MADIFDTLEAPRSALGKVTDYGQRDDPHGDSLTRAGKSAIGKLTPESLAVSPDIEQEFRRAGIKLGERVTLELEDGQTMSRIWDDRTAGDAVARKIGLPPLRGRFDLFSPEGRHPLRDAKIVGFARGDIFDGLDPEEENAKRQTPNAKLPTVEPAEPDAHRENWVDRAAESASQVKARVLAGLAENTALAGQGMLRGIETLKPQLDLSPARGFLRDVQERAAADYGVDPARDAEFSSKLIQGATSVPPVLASGPAALATGAGLMGESVAQEAEAAGATPGQQQAAFALGAGTGLVSEALLGVPALLRSAAQAAGPEAARTLARQVAAQFLKSTGREATQEATEQVAQNLIASTAVGYDPQRPATEGVGEAALIGGIVGGPVGATVQTAATLDARRAVPEVPRSALRVPRSGDPLVAPDLTESLQTAIDPAALTGYDIFDDLIPEAPGVAPAAVSDSDAGDRAGGVGAVVAPTGIAPAPGTLGASGEGVAPQQSATEEGAGATAIEPGLAPVDQPGGAKRRSFRVAHSDPFFEDPVVQVIMGAGGLMSKAEAIRRWGAAKYRENAGEFEDLGPLASPLHNAIYSKKRGLQPDDALKAVVEAGLFPTDAVPADLARHLQNASLSAKRQRAQLAAQRRNQIEATRQGKAFERDAITPKKPDAPAVPAETLNVGDTVTVGEEKFKVTAVDPDTYDVTLEDGKKYGVQIVASNEVIFAEHEPAAPAPDVFDELAADPSLPSVPSVPAPFELATQTEADVAAERERARVQAEIEKRQSSPLAGTAGDLTADIFGPTEGETPLFNQRQDQPLESPEPGAPPPIIEVPRRFAFRERTTIPVVLERYGDIVRALGGSGTIRFGRFLQRALGVYKPHEGVARIGNAGNLATAAHEIAHATQHHAFGDWGSSVLKARLRPVVFNQLVLLGRKLYGTRVPVNGYASEGFAEFVRHYLTRDDAATVAPAVEKWFTTEWLLNQPKAVQKAFAAARHATDVWRQQGDLARQRAQNPDAPGRLQRALKAIPEKLSVVNWIEALAPLRALAQEHERLTGRKLTDASNPYELASTRRGSSGAVALQMALHGMTDLHGNLALYPSGRPIGSLKEILQPARADERGFISYLHARRAVELHGRGMDPGLDLDDATSIIAKMETAHPQFAVAAQRLYDWQDAVLDYLSQAVPALAGNIAAMKAVNRNYIPLQRVVETRSAERGTRKGDGGAVYRIKGSGRQVKPILEQILKNTQSLVATAHRGQVLETIVRLAQTPGLGHLIEEVPRDRVRESVNFEKLREELEAMGVDTTAVPTDTLLDFYTLAQEPKGTDPVLPIRVGNELRWFHLEPELYDTLAALETPQLTGLANVFLAAPARVFRLGTTGLRASFSLVTNPLRDIQTLLTQTQATDNPARALAAYLGALREVLVSSVSKQPTPLLALFERLGVEGGQALGIDVDFTRRAARRLTRGAVLNAVTSPIDFLRATLNFMESVPRIAEMKMTAKNIGWTPGTPITADQAVQIANAGKRATVDFSAGGTLAKQWNQAIPFFNAVVQGGRSTARTFRQRPVAATMRALAYSILPALGLWWLNRDKEWWRNLPLRERFLYYNFSPDGKNVVQIPRSQEWGAFGVLAEGLADHWFAQDPEAASAALGHIAHTVNPLDYPVLLKAAKQQWENRIAFFDRPIVPRSQEDLPPGEQVAPYTSTISKQLGLLFPNRVSPRRLDTAVRDLFGGTGGDVLARTDDVVRLLGLTPQREHRREFENSDWPVLGRLFRRGGITTANNRVLSEFWDNYVALEARRESKLTPLAPQERAYLSWLSSRSSTNPGPKEQIKMIERLAEATMDMDGRQRLYGAAAEVARTALALKPKPQATR